MRSSPNNPQAVAATGFLTAAAITILPPTHLEEERLRNRYNELDDMLSTIGTGMLGLTLGCARCHDHKYDAISSREYYRLLAALHGGDRQVVKLPESGSEALVFQDQGGEPRATWLFSRGDFYDRDQPVQLGFLDVLMRGRTPDDYWTAARRDPPREGTTFQRKALAAWMTDVEHGAGALAARVIVNRVWQHHFGEGLVRTVSDFGVRSEAPTHPELLEWLANDFVANGWQLKRLHRLILTSAVYRQGRQTLRSAIRTPQAVDPDNRLLWHKPPQRLEAEILRDAMLAVSGTLNLEPFGPAFKPPIPAEAMVARNTKSPYPDGRQGRRQRRAAAASTCSTSGSCPIRCCRRSTGPTPSKLRPPRPDDRRPAGAGAAERRFRPRPGRRLRRPAARRRGRRSQPGESRLRAGPVPPAHRRANDRPRSSS